MRFLFRNPFARFAIFLLLVVAIGYLSLTTLPDLTGLTFFEEIPQESGSVDLLFCQVDNCEAALLSELLAAEDIKCAFYDLDLEALQLLLERKDAETLIFEKNYDGFGTEVSAAHGGLMHNKFCILDEKTVITGSTNPTRNGVTKNDNNLLIIESEYLAQNYLDEFEELRGAKEYPVLYELINHTDPAANESFLIENYFCPEDDCEDEVVAELAEAQEAIFFMTFSFTSDPIGTLLAEKQEAGIPVAGVFERRQESQWSEFEKLQEAGADVRFDANPATMHHKVFIIDPDSERATVIFGSYNPTKNGNTRNDENVLIVHDKAFTQAFLEEYERVRGVS